MSSDWVHRDEGGEQWYENTVTGEVTYDIPPGMIDNFDAIGTGFAEYGAESVEAGWQEDTTGYEWSDTTGEWGSSKSFDPSKQTGLYDFSKGYFGEDGMWYDDDNMSPSPEASMIPVVTGSQSYRGAEDSGGYHDESTGDVYAPEVSRAEETWPEETGHVDESTGMYYADEGGYWDEEGNWVDTSAAPADEGNVVGYVDEATGDVTFEDTAAEGYYDGKGNWIDPGSSGGDFGGYLEAAPEADEGYYDEEGNWVDDGGGAQPDEGSYDEEENWVEAAGAPAADEGFYDDEGNWVEGTGVGGSAEGEGYYDDEGNWIEPEPADAAAEGYYDEEGNWIEPVPTQPAAEGYYDEEGNWIELKPATAAEGYYDEEGNWIEPEPVAVEPAAEGYWGEEGEWHDAGASALVVAEPVAEAPVDGTVVITILRAKGLRKYRLHEAEDSYDALSMMSMIGKSNPWCHIGFTDEPARVLGMTHTAKSVNPDWCHHAPGLPATGEGHPKARFEVLVQGRDRAEGLMVEVMDGDGPELAAIGGHAECLGRAVLPLEAVLRALEHSFADGGAGTTVTLPLKDRPLAAAHEAKGEVVLRIDPMGAPTVRQLPLSCNLLFLFRS